MHSHNCQSAVYVCTNNTKTPHGLLLEMSFVFILIYIDIWCHTGCPLLGQGVFFQYKSQRNLCIKSTQFEGHCFYNPLTFLPVKNCSQNEKPFTRTMKLGVPALTKNLLTYRHKGMEEVHFKEMSSSK